MKRPPRRADRAGPSPLPPATEERIWAEVQRRIALGSDGRPHLAPVPDRRPLVVTVALVACALVVAGLLSAQRPGSSEGVATDTTVDSPVTLDDLAAVAGEQPLRRLGARQVLDLTIDHLPTDAQRQAGMVGWRELQSMAGDGRGQRRLTSLPGAPGTVENETETFEEPGSVLVAGFTIDEIAALPGDPDALLAALQEPSGLEDGSPSPSYFLELLAVPVVPPAARAALFALLADLGAEVVGPTTDARGRRGVTVVSSALDGERIEAVIDPATTALLSLRRDDPRFTEYDPAVAVYHAARFVPDG